METAILVLSTAVGLAITYWIILSAVRTALTQHYKMVRRFEATGEWLRPWGSWKQAPEALDGSEDPQGPEEIESFVKKPRP